MVERFNLRLIHVVGDDCLASARMKSKKLSVNKNFSILTIPFRCLQRENGICT